MAIEAKKHGLAFVTTGAVILFLTTFYFPNLYHNVPHYLAITWFMLLPIGLILFVLGVFRLSVNAALAIWKKTR